MPDEFTNDPIVWIQDRDHAAQLLTAYLTPGMFTGSLWDPAIERHLGPADRSVIDVEDLYSPALLSAPIRSSAGQTIIENANVIHRHLRDIDPDVSLWDQESKKVDGALVAAEELIRELETIPQVGPTRASKLVAAKRPHLVPIWDSQVSRALGADRMSWQQYWTAWRRTITPAVDELRSLATKVGHPTLSPLRTIDIIIWMDEWGWNDLPDAKWGDLRDACQSRHMTRE